MNHLQFCLFFVYLFSMLIAGIGLYSLMDPKNSDYLNRHVYSGEALLLGSILLVGELVILSLIGLYRVPFLWGAVILNYAFLFRKDTRERFLGLLKERAGLDVPLFLFLALMAVFIFRNMFFLVDVDSHSTYLFAQKLWLSQGTSLVGDTATDIRIFAPQFNAVPYALGLSLFKEDTLFPHLVVISWTLIALLLVFGYASYRFNRYYGLAAAMFVLFNDHIFYSGANSCCIINGAVICFLWAAAYNFWVGRDQNNFFRFTLALIFLSQVMANKYQMAYSVIFLAALGILIQEYPVWKIRQLLEKKKFLFPLLVSVLFLLLWYVKNYLATGLATFPILADKFQIFNWTPDMAHTFNKIFGGGMSFAKFIKYAGYFFVWPGISASKYLWMIIVFLPLLILMNAMKTAIDKDAIRELGYWLCLSTLMVLGLYIVHFVDPRHYRYYIGIFSFSLIFSVDYIFRHCLGIRKRILSGFVILVLSLSGYSIIFDQGGSLKRPTFQDNVGVILNRLHFSDIVIRYYPQNLAVDEGFEAHREMAMKGAWDTGVAGVTPLSAFLLPIRPQVGLWHTTVVQWDSYNNPESVVTDLENYGIKWIMRVKDGRLIFLSLEEYAKEAVLYDRHPKKFFYDYGFPRELSEMK